MSPEDLKEEGNALFKAGNWDGALSCYTRAISLSPSGDRSRAALLKNRAAVHLKKEQYSDVVDDCTAVLDSCPGDVKALYRRCLALEQLGSTQKAYRDASQLLVADPKNRDIQPVMSRLHTAVQIQMEENSRLSGRLRVVCQYLFDSTSGEQQKRVDSANNLIVLAKEDAGAQSLFDEDIHKKIQTLLKTESNEEVTLACIRALSQMCHGRKEMTCTVVRDLGVTWLVDLLNTCLEDRVAAAQYLLQGLLNTLADMDVRSEKAADSSSIQQYRREISSIMSVLCVNINSRAFSAHGRDAIIQLVLKNCPFKCLNWSPNFIKAGGIQRLMEVASEYSGCPDESSMSITDSTRTTVAVCMSTLYDDMSHDQARQQFVEAVDDFVKSKLVTPDMEGKIRVVSAITVLMQGPVDAGNKMLSTEGVLEMMLAMANSSDITQQRVACEAIIAASSKKDKCKSIIAQGVSILKQLYQSKEDSIRVRALVGLCKIGSVGGTDALVRPFADGSTMKLAEACRRFLVNPSKDKELRRWATEGLSYLTLDAEVKERLVEDRASLQAMLELAKTGDHSVVYGVVTTLVNLTNSYDKQEVIPEMLELAKFAKQHVPEEHELDDEDFITKRIEILAKEGVSAALAALSKTESQNSRELISRVFNAVCLSAPLRGLVVQQGGTRALISMALECTDKGRKQAAQALARIAITINPATAFPGQRCCEVIRPLLSLLHPECTALENFEALMALCNLCGMNETVRQRVVKEKGVAQIEQYMYEEHVMLRRAATQCVTNLICCPDYLRLLEGRSDRLKFLVLLIGEEDEQTSLAAAGALAMATSISKVCCSKILEVKSWHEMFRVMLASSNEDLRLRGVVTTGNMIRAGREVAEVIVETDVTEILMALSKLPPETDNGKKIMELSERTLKEAHQQRLIRRAGEYSDSD